MYATLIKKHPVGTINSQHKHDLEAANLPRSVTEALAMDWWPKLIGPKPIEEFSSEDVVTVAFFPPRGTGITKFQMLFGATPFCPIWKRTGREILEFAKNSGWKMSLARESKGVTDPRKSVKVFIDIPGSDNEIVLRCQLLETPFWKNRR